MKTSVACFVGLCMVCSSVGGGGFPAFKYHRIDGIGRKLGQTALADIDNDGDLDWIAGEADHGGSRIWWWEYKSPDNWVRHFTGNGRTEVGGAALDINNDGWVDMFSGSRILINTHKPRTEPFRVFDIAATYSHDSELADINGDGRFDAIANWDKAGLFWYEIPADCTKKWTEHIIARNKPCHEAVGGDVDGDGDIDICSKPWSTGNEHFYLENLLVGKKPR